MSEEEAIERLKERVKLDRKIRDNKTESDYEQFCENECKAIEIILNLADKQRKEIEEKNVAINKMSKDISRQLKEIERLNFENHMVKKWNEQLDKNCISKDKIIEWLDRFDIEEDLQNEYDELLGSEAIFKFLKKLLEEN